jgi:hypothetical protein
MQQLVLVTLVLFVLSLEYAGIHTARIYYKVVQRNSLTFNFILQLQLAASLTRPSTPLPLLARRLRVPKVR